jgi:DNA-binding NtrC family response regulator
MDAGHSPVRELGGTVLIVGRSASWPRDLVRTIADEGYTIRPVDDVAEVPILVRAGGVSAVFLHARGLGTRDLLALRAAREDSPRTAVVVMSPTSTPPELKRAIDSGATSFLSWPASIEVLRQVLRSGSGGAP